MITILSFIGYILTFGSMGWMALYMFQSRRREYCTLEIKSGEICYRCKSHIRKVDYWSDKHSKQLCKSCKRDDSLGDVIGKKRLTIDFTQEKWSKTFLIFNLSAILFNVINIFLPGLNIIGGLCLFIGQSFFYFRFMALTRKKTQSN